MQKYWRPGLRVWWRCDGEAQLGLDPPAILFGLSTQITNCWRRSRRRIRSSIVGRWRSGWAGNGHVHPVPAQARRTHSLTRRPRGHGDAPVLVLMERRRAHHTARVGARSSSTRRCWGSNSPMRSRQRAWTPSSYDPRPVPPRRAPGRFHTDDVGRVREQAALHRLRPRHPMAKLRAGREAIDDAAVAPPIDPASSCAHSAHGRSPHGVYAPHLRAPHPGSGAEGVSATLAVLVAHGAVEPRRVRPYALRETPVLPVVVRELDVVIGPLLHAGGPCVRCLHLTLTDEDLRWPAVATQLASETNPGIDPVVSQLAAALAAHQVIAIADERPAAVVGRSLHVDGAHPVPRHRAWHPHARCGCQRYTWRSATPAGVAAVHPTADSAGEGDGSGCFRGRPRPRLFATILPSTKISPPHTPQGSSRSSAPWRHSTRSGQVPQRDCARLRSGACSANQRSTVSRFWHGKVRSRSSVAMRTSNDVDNVAPK